MKSKKSKLEAKVSLYLPTLLKLRHCHDLTESGFLLNLDSETVLLAEIRANYLRINVTLNGNINYNRHLSKRQTLEWYSEYFLEVEWWGKINYGSFVCDDFHANYLSHLPSGVSQDACLLRRSLGNLKSWQKGDLFQNYPKFQKHCLENSSHRWKDRVRGFIYIVTLFKGISSLKKKKNFQ